MTTRDRNETKQAILIFTVLGSVAGGVLGLFALQVLSGNLDWSRQVLVVVAGVAVGTVVAILLKSDPPQPPPPTRPAPGAPPAGNWPGPRHPVPPPPWQQNGPGRPVGPLLDNPTTRILPHQQPTALPAAPRHAAEPSVHDPALLYLPVERPAPTPSPSKWQGWGTSSARPASGAESPAARTPAPDLSTYIDSARVVQCPECHEFRINVSQQGSVYDFHCRVNNHRWQWQPGTPWPNRAQVGTRPASHGR